MSPGNNDQLNAQAALDHARQVEDTIRRRARWHGWVWLTIGIITPVFLIGANANAVPGDVQFWTAIGFMVVAATLAIWETKRGIWGREAVEADRPATWAYMIAIVAFAIPTIVLDPVDPPIWLIGLALVPSIPCFIAAWRILRK